MGSMNPNFVDLSSDEELDPRIDDFKWLTEVLKAFDAKSDSFDEVELVSEAEGDAKTSNKKTISLNPTVEDEDDDDCVVLDGDPDKTATPAVVDGDNAEETDEVLVVGQKGEIACRDFPHPRHACAKYPFSSTPHDKYCDMCHCYVCDIRAPCRYWCVGDSTINHCHANNKEIIWRNQREYFRTGKMPSRSVPKPRMHLRTPASSIISSSPNPLPQTQFGIRPCSSSSRNPIFPNIKSSCRIRQPRTISPNLGIRHRPPMQLLTGVRNGVIQKNKSSFTGNLRPRALSTPQPNLSSSGHASLNSIQYTNAFPLLATSEERRGLLNREMHIQTGIKPPGYLSAGPASRSHLYDWHSQNERNTDLSAASVQTRHQIQADPRCIETQQQVEMNNIVGPPSKLLMEFEDWLMDNTTEAGASLFSEAEEVSVDEGTLTFDFESFLNS